MAEITQKLQNFDWMRLSKIKGNAHEGLIGCWINWWLNLDLDNHMVFNPARCVQNRYADIAFLKKIDDYYHHIGFAEIENEPKKWEYKLETLKACAEQYSQPRTLDFLLLCVTTRPKDEQKFQELRKHVMDASKELELNYVLYRLMKSPWKDETTANGIIKENDDVWYYESISSIEFFVDKEGKEIRKIREGSK